MSAAKMSLDINDMSYVVSGSGVWHAGHTNA